MATIRFSAYKVADVREYFSQVTGEMVKSVSISIGIGAGEPFPSELIEATRTADIRPAFDAYVERAKASGMKLQLSARVAAGRSPNGFDKADLKAHVNI